MESLERSGSSDFKNWSPHMLRVGSHRPELIHEPTPNEHREHVEPWLSALFQAEHLNLLIGSGFTTAVALAAGANVVDMSTVRIDRELSNAIEKAAAVSASRMGRGKANFEDQIRAIQELIGGLRILAGVTHDENKDSLVTAAARLLPLWEEALDRELSEFLHGILAMERSIERVLTEVSSSEGSSVVGRLLGGFLLPFASRSGTRERLHIFTTNYDRLIEYGCDLIGLRLLDRFVGSLTPVFHASRLGVDLHYNPPGIRGEPRYLEGVVRLTKLHGSLDWRFGQGSSGYPEVQRCALPFGAVDGHPALPEKPGTSVLVYPNPAKDVETLDYPYADLFRDCAASLCQPNSVVVTYGYGFGDDHLNRILANMLTIPSTHLVLISYDSAEGRIERFCRRVRRDEQMTLLIGNHFGDLSTLIEYYLPKPTIDRTTWRMMSLLGQRARPKSENVDCKDASTGDGRAS